MDIWRQIMNTNEFEKCEFKTDKQGTCNKGFGKPYCQDNRECPLKQLLALKEENEWLNEGWKMCGQEGRKIIAELKEENERLEKKYKDLEDRFNKYMQSLSGYARFDSNILIAKDKEIEELQKENKYFVYNDNQTGENTIERLCKEDI